MEVEATVLAEMRATAALVNQISAALPNLDSRFNANGGTPGFKGVNKLFDSQGGGQAVPFDSMLGLLNAYNAVKNVQSFKDFIAAAQML